MNVTVRVDAAGVRRALSGLSEATQRRALVRSINRGVDAGRTEAGRATREELNLKLAAVREVVTVRKAPSSLASGEIVIVPKDVGLIDYAARPTARGVTVKVKTKGARKLVRSAFIATMKSGHVGVFTRTPKSGGDPPPRLPIRELFSTSVRQLFKRRAVVERVTRAAGLAFLRESTRQIQLARRGRSR